jgi:hypothetical protein
MFGLIRTAVRFFILGLAVGVLIAPRAGAETRRLLGDRFQSVVNQLLEIIGLPPIEAPAEGPIPAPPPAPAAASAPAPVQPRPRRRTAEPGAGASA